MVRRWFLLAGSLAWGGSALSAQEPAPVATVWNLDWAHQRPGLVRYNRVEGLSLGARASVRFGAWGGPLSAALTARAGSADRDPRGTLALTREGWVRSVSLVAYRELQERDPSVRALGAANSATALLFGRDDGDWVQATGVGLSLTPPVALRPSYRVRLYAERQEPVARETDASLAHALDWDDGFRPVLPAVRADQWGAELAWMPWWGPVPDRVGAGVDLGLVAERGDHDFTRVRLGVGAGLPLPAGFRLALSAAGGATRGAAPPQRAWILGGPATVRGFAPGARTGRSFLRGRAELLTPIPLPALRAVALAAFADAGWAGEGDSIRWDDALASAGMGLSVLGGVVRLDAAWGWHGPAARRLDLYLDGRP